MIKKKRKERKNKPVEFNIHLMQVKCERVLNTCLSKELLLPFKFSAKIIREIEYEKAGFYTVLVRIMHARRECKIRTIHPAGDFGERKKVITGIARERIEERLPAGFT